MTADASVEKPNQIRPGVVTGDGRTIYPTGAEWVLAFALAGCQWAIDEIESGRLVAPTTKEATDRMIAGVHGTQGWL